MHHVATMLRLGHEQAGVVHHRQLRAAGLPRKVISTQCAAGLLIELHPRVFRIAGTQITWEQRLWSELLCARRDAVVSHRSAARVHGIGRFTEAHFDLVEPINRSNRISVASPHSSTWVPAHHRTLVRGIPVTTIPRTVFDLASQVSVKRYRRGLPSLRHRQVARALDDALGSGTPFDALDGMLSELGGRGRGGTVVLRGLLATRGEGFVATESELEDLLCAVLDEHGLPRPLRQRTLGGLEDRVGRVDFLYAGTNVVIEADGRKNHTALLDREGDAWRDLELTAAGFTVIRVTWTQLTDDPRRFVANLRRLLARGPA